MKSHKRTSIAGMLALLMLSLATPSAELQAQALKRNEMLESFTFNTLFPYGYPTPGYVIGSNTIQAYENITLMDDGVMSDAEKVQLSMLLDWHYLKKKINVDAGTAKAVSNLKTKYSFTAEQAQAKFKDYEKTFGSLKAWLVKPNYPMDLGVFPRAEGELYFRLSGIPSDYRDPGFRMALHRHHETLQPMSRKTIERLEQIALREDGVLDKADMYYIITFYEGFRIYRHCSPIDYGECDWTIINLSTEDSDRALQALKAKYGFSELEPYQYAGLQITQRLNRAVEEEVRKAVALGDSGFQEIFQVPANGRLEAWSWKYLSWGLADGPAILWADQNGNLYLESSIYRSIPPEGAYPGNMGKLKVRTRWFKLNVSVASIIEVAASSD